MCVTNPAGRSFGQLLEPGNSGIIREFKARNLLCQPGDTEPLSQVVPFLTDHGHALGFHIKKFKKNGHSAHP